MSVQNLHELGKIYQAFELLHGDCLQQLATLPAASVQCCVTSPPYWGLRDYGTAGQLGLEATPDEYVANMVAVFRAVRRVLRDDGTLWLNLGDSYTSGNRADRDPALVSSSSGLTNRSNGLDRARTPVGLKPKDLVGIPWRVAFALQADGWWLRQDIIWHKPNPMPESVTDRCTKAHEYIFLMTKSAKYYYDNKAIMEPAAYDGRKDTVFKGSDKYANGFVPNTSAKTIAVMGHERWPNSLHTGKTGEKHSGYKNPDGSLRINVKDGVPARNKRSVWTVTTKPFKGAHFATFPLDLIEPCVLAGSKPGDTLLDPFNGAGTTGVVSVQHGRRYIGIELNPDYLEMSRKRIQLVRDSLTVPMFAGV